MSASFTKCTKVLGNAILHYFEFTIISSAWQHSMLPVLSYIVRAATLTAHIDVPG